MKKPFLHLVSILVLLALISGCDDPEKPISPNNLVEIRGVPGTMEANAYETVGPLKVQVFGEDLLSSFRILKNGTEIQVFNLNLTGLKYFTTTFTYEANPLEIGKEIVFEFEAMDLNGDKAKSEMKIKVSGMSNAITVKSDISSDQTWETDKTYVLTEKISVLPGATLTLQKGVIVKFGVRDGDKIPLLAIERGAKIMAEGTADAPIILTSILDKIQPGQLESSFQYQWYIQNPADTWQWGGLVLLGKAKGSFPGDVSEISLNGEANSNFRLMYGGEDALDNSGILNYVSIRYAGPLTLAGVGKGTRIDKVEVYEGKHDGIKIMGGTVTLENIIISDAKSGLSIDQGWSGTIENFYMTRCWDAAIVVSGPKGAYYGGNHHIRKGTFDISFGDQVLLFEENSNTDLSKLYFEFFGLIEEMSFPNDGIDKLINRVPTVYPSQVSELEVFSKSPISPALFLSWSDKVKILTSPLPSSSVGGDSEPFKKWSIIQEELIGQY